MLENYTDDTKKGIILELEYPGELHDLHNDYPAAPEKIIINNDMISDYCKELKEKNISGKFKKLVPSLMDKEKYVLHYKICNYI